MEITRRSFFKLGAVLGLGSALPGCAKKPLLEPAEEPLPAKGEEKYVLGVCGMCPAGCGIRVRKTDGRAAGVAGIPEHPVNRGGLCPKGAAMLQELYHPDRLRGPSASQGGRGSGRWSPISWEEALRRVSERLAAASARGGASIAVVAAAGVQDAHRELLLQLAGSLGKGNALFLGQPDGEPPLDAHEELHHARLSWRLERARLLVCFGWDWLQSHPSHVSAQRAFAELRGGGSGERAHIVQIEPRFSVSAAKADEWIPIRPGAEGILALGLARQLLANGTYDRDFVRGHVRGFEEFKKAVEPYSVSEVSRAAGVAPETIRLLAVKFLGRRPAAVIGCRGPRLDQLAIHALNVLLGSVGPSKPFELLPAMRSSSPAPERYPDGAWDPGAWVPEVLLVDRVNPLFLAPSRWRAVLEKVPLVVTVSPYRTETAELSDLVLPCHTPLEGLHCSRHAAMDGRSVLNAALPVVGPLYDTQEPGEIFAALAAAVRGSAWPAGGFEARVRAKLKALGAEKLLGEDSDRTWLELAGGAAPSGPVGLGKLAEEASRLRLSLSPEDPEFPLRLHLFTPLAFSRGEGAHLPFLQGAAAPQMEEIWDTWAELHPETAAACGVSDHDAVWVESRAGKIRARARLARAAMPGVVSVPVGLGHTAYGRWAAGVGSNPMELAAEGRAEALPVRVSRA